MIMLPSLAMIVVEEGSGRLPVAHPDATNCTSIGQTPGNRKQRDGRAKIGLNEWRKQMLSKVAVIQTPPVLLDRAKTIEAVLASIEEAVSQGASLLVFPEAYIPGYPTWIWRLKPGEDSALSGEIHARLRGNAVDLARGDLKPLQDAAAKHRVTLVIGIDELDSQFSGTTLFNTVVVIGPDGTLLNRHRKMMPTNPERMVWGMGDATGLKVVDTPAGRLGALICWENYMPLARYALYAQDLDILVAPTWDTGESWLATMRHIAKEAGCWVIGTATALQGSDIPPRLPPAGPAVPGRRVDQRRRCRGDQADGRNRRRTAAQD
jgi:nitrilase